MTKIDVGILAITGLVVVALGVLQGLGQSLSVLPEVLLTLVGVLVGKSTGPVVTAMKARKARKQQINKIRKYEYEGQCFR